MVMIKAIVLITILLYIKILSVQAKNLIIARFEKRHFFHDVFYDLYRSHQVKFQSLPDWNRDYNEGLIAILEERNKYLELNSDFIQTTLQKYEIACEMSTLNSTLFAQFLWMFGHGPSNISRFAQFFGVIQNKDEIIKHSYGLAEILLVGGNNPFAKVFVYWTVLVAIKEKEFDNVSICSPQRLISSPEAGKKCIITMCGMRVQREEKTTRKKVDFGNPYILHIFNDEKRVNVICDMLYGEVSAIAEALKAQIPLWNSSITWSANLDGYSNSKMLLPQLCFDKSAPHINPLTRKFSTSLICIPSSGILNDGYCHKKRTDVASLIHDEIAHYLTAMNFVEFNTASESLHLEHIKKRNDITYETTTLAGLFYLFRPDKYGWINFYIFYYDMRAFLRGTKKGPKILQTSIMDHIKGTSDTPANSDSIIDIRIVSLLESALKRNGYVLSKIAEIIGKIDAQAGSPSIFARSPVMISDWYGKLHDNEFAITFITMIYILSFNGQWVSQISTMKALGKRVTFTSKIKTGLKKVVKFVVPKRLRNIIKKIKELKGKKDIEELKNKIRKHIPSSTIDNVLNSFKPVVHSDIMKIITFGAEHIPEEIRPLHRKFPQIFTDSIHDTKYPFTSDIFGRYGVIDDIESLVKDIGEEGLGRAEAKRQRAGSQSFEEGVVSDISDWLKSCLKNVEDAIGTITETTLGYTGIQFKTQLGTLIKISHEMSTKLTKSANIFVVPSPIHTTRPGGFSMSRLLRHVKHLALETGRKKPTIPLWSIWSIHSNKIIDNLNPIFSLSDALVYRGVTNSTFSKSLINLFKERIDELCNMSARIPKGVRMNEATLITSGRIQDMDGESQLNEYQLSSACTTWKSLTERFLLTVSEIISKRSDREEWENTLRKSDMVKKLRDPLHMHSLSSLLGNDAFKYVTQRLLPEDTIDEVRSVKSGKMFFFAAVCHFTGTMYNSVGFPASGTYMKMTAPTMAKQAYRLAVQKSSTRAQLPFALAGTFGTFIYVANSYKDIVNQATDIGASPPPQKSAYGYGCIIVHGIVTCTDPATITTVMKGPEAIAMAQVLSVGLMQSVLNGVLSAIAIKNVWTIIKFIFPFFERLEMAMIDMVKKFRVMVSDSRMWHTIHEKINSTFNKKEKKIIPPKKQIEQSHMKQVQSHVKQEEQSELKQEINYQSQTEEDNYNYDEPHFSVDSDYLDQRKHDTNQLNASTVEKNAYDQTQFNRDRKPGPTTNPYNVVKFEGDGHLAPSVDTYNRVKSIGNDDHYTKNDKSNQIIEESDKPKPENEIFETNDTGYETITYPGKLHNDANSHATYQDHIANAGTLPPVAKSVNENAEILQPAYDDFVTKDSHRLSPQKV